MSTDDPQAWKIYGERTLYDNPWVQLVKVDLEPPGVRRFEHHVVRLGHAAIAAVVQNEHVLMLWRYRFVPDRWGWELPGGLVDDGEDPAVAAAREVEEETGWRPHALVKIVDYQPIIGMVDAPHDLYIASGATQVGAPRDAEEAGSVSWVPLSDIPQMLARGDLLGSGTLIGLLHVLTFGLRKG